MWELVDELVEEARTRTPVVVVDVHAEATSEKVALARWLDGRVTAVLGTHTHVQTSDARIQPGGTAAITDVGMTGPHDSVIGVVGARDPPHADGHARALRDRRGAASASRASSSTATPTARYAQHRGRCAPVALIGHTSSTASATSARSRASTAHDAAWLNVTRSPSSGSGTRPG